MIAMSTLVLLLVLSLGSARLTRLINDDEITAPIRAWTVRRWGVQGKIPYLLHCRWCVGLWMSALLCGFAWGAGVCRDPAVAALLIPAVAYGAAIIRSMIEE